MTIYTQDIVSKLPGGQSLLNKTLNVFKHRNSKLEFMSNGFLMHVDGLPYYFQLNYFKDFGWNVFLCSINGKTEDDKETDRYYFKLEHYVDMVNASILEEEDDIDMRGNNTSFFINVNNSKKLQLV